MSFLRLRFDGLLLHYMNAIEATIRSLSQRQLELTPCEGYTISKLPRQSGLSQVFAGSGSFLSNHDIAALLYEKTPYESPSYHNPPNVRRLQHAAPNTISQMTQIIDNILPSTPPSPQIDQKQVFHIPGKQKTDTPMPSPYNVSAIPTTSQARLSNHNASRPHK